MSITIPKITKYLLLIYLLAIFDPSRVFGHAAQLIDTMQMKELNPSVFVFQADGGPDRSIKRLQTKILCVAVFKIMDFDHLLALWSAPNGSVHNRVERAMSPLGFALINVSTKRNPMAEWAEKYVKHCGSMSEVRAVRDKNFRHAAAVFHVFFSPFSHWISLRRYIH